MDKPDAQDAAPIATRLLTHLAATIAPTSGDAGALARATIGSTIAGAYLLLRDDALGQPLLDCFNQVQQAGATRAQLEQVRAWTTAELPQTLGGQLMQNSGIQLCLAIEAQIIATTTYISRQDVETVKASLRQPFNDAEEIAADDMDQAAFAALIGLDAAVTNFLVTTARPLPRMIGYQFAASLPSLVLAYRLYQDASRADQLVQENKVVHPAFCPAIGLALSA